MGIRSWILFPAVLMASACCHGTMLYTSTVFSKGEGGVHTYRIPAIAKSREGTLLAFAEARNDGSGDSGDIDLVLKRSTDGGRSWSEAITVWDAGSDVCGNPVPVVLGSGRILLVCTWNKGSDKEMAIHRRESEDTRRVFCLHSDDDGLSWSIPEEITGEVKDPEWTWYATGPGHGLLTKDGKVVIPCNHGVYGSEGPEGTVSHIIFSTDEGRSWNIGAVAPNGNECTVSELADGELLLNMREWYPDGRKRSGRRLGMFIRRNLTPEPDIWKMGLPDPNCQGSQISDRKGRLYFSNPSTTDARRNLVIHKDIDGHGQTWTPFCTITEGPAAYSDLVILWENPVWPIKTITGVLYETGEEGPYERIDFTAVR